MKVKLQRFGPPFAFISFSRMLNQSQCFFFFSCSLWSSLPLEPFITSYIQFGQFLGSFKVSELQIFCSLISIPFSNHFTMEQKWIIIEPFRVGYDLILEPRTKSCLPFVRQSPYELGFSLCRFLIPSLLGLCMCMSLQGCHFFAENSSLIILSFLSPKLNYPKLLGFQI